MQTIQVFIYLFYLNHTQRYTHTHTHTHTHILCKHRDYDSAYNDLLLTAASTMIHWYKMNFMQPNPEKFQFIILDKERQPRTLQLNHNVTIQSVLNVKLLNLISIIT